MTADELIAHRAHRKLFITIESLADHIRSDIDRLIAAKVPVDEIHQWLHTECRIPITRRVVRRYVQAKCR